MTASFATYRQELQVFQSARLRRDFADFAEHAQYAELGEFFFTEMYGARDFSARNAATRKLQHFTYLAPGLELNDITQAVELLDLTQWLDDMMAQCIMAMKVALPFSEAAYEYAYRVVGSYAHRERQIELACSTLFNIHRITGVPFVGTALRQLRPVAIFTGIAELHDFLLKGHDAFRPVQDVHYFVETLRTRETDRLQRIFAAAGSQGGDV